MITKHALKRMVETRTPEGAVNDIRHALGVADANGNRYYDSLGRQVINTKEAKLHPSEFSIRALFEAIVGEQALENALQGRPLTENAGVAAVSPTAFVNINAFTLATAGLFEFKILEAFNSPEFIGDRLAEVEPTSVMGGVKHIGVANFGDLAKERKSGNPVSMFGLEERWIEAPETVEYSGGIELTFEAVASDITGQLLNRAASVGKALGLRKEYRLIDTVLGVTNTYKYKGSSYDTYQTATPWINSFANPLVDWQDINDVLVKFSEMRDPETRQPILVNPTDIFVMPQKLLTARKIFRDTVVQARTQSAAVVSVGANPVFGVFDPITSPLAYKRVTDASSGIPDPGLGLSGNDAHNLYFVGDFKKAFGYRQFHPIQVQTAMPSTYEMLSRRVVSAFFAYERGTPFVKEPRYVIKCTNS